MSAVLPENGPPRIWRFVDADAMPHPDTVAVHDRRTNVVTINRPLFDSLDPRSQDRVRKMDVAVIELRTPLAA